MVCCDKTLQVGHLLGHYRSILCLFAVYYVLCIGDTYSVLSLRLNDLVLQFFLICFASTLTSAVPHADAALGFGIKEDQLTALTRDHNYSALQQYGGVR